MSVGDRRYVTAAPWVAVAVVITALIAVYWSTFASLVALWQESDTFAHCFLIAPISLYLIWRKRADLAAAPMRVSLVGLAAIAILALGWFVASSADVQVGQQLMAVLLLPAAVVALIGVEAAKRIAFPLAYLLFAVPFGENLIPALMEFTASFTVAALRLTGIPVLREGLFFSIPSGTFEVAKACSGIRYLIASVALGVLYSYLVYTSFLKRAVFVAVSIVAPIIANGIRAYLIVMIAHLSEMRLAVGVDHLIYGWVFFGLLMVALFWAGSFFQDPQPAPDSNPTVGRFATGSASTGVVALSVGVILAIGAAAVGPTLERAWPVSAATAQARLPAVVGSWNGPEAPSAAWLRPLAGARSVRGHYAGVDAAVELELVQSEPSAAAGELVGAVARMIDPERAPIFGTGSQTLSVHDRELSVRETVLREGRLQRVLWHWYVIGGSYTSADWHAKFLEAWNALVHRRSDTVLVLASSSSSATADEARAALRDFLPHALRKIDECLARRSSECPGSL